MLIKLCYTNPIKGDVVMLTKRNVVSSLVLSFVTCGIYYLYWLYKFDEDLKLELENDNNPLLDVILIFVTCGLYSVYLYYRNAQQVSKIYDKYGASIQDNSVICLILALFGLGFVALMIQQDSINNLIDSS